jgi:hypothetical protein
MEAYPQPMETHPWAAKDHHGAVKAHHRAGKTQLELWRGRGIFIVSETRVALSIFEESNITQYIFLSLVWDNGYHADILWTIEITFMTVSG